MNICQINFVQIAEESCSISPDMFVSNYVMQRKPVVLKVLLIFKNCDVTKCDEYENLCGNVIEQLYITKEIKSTRKIIQGCLDSSLFRPFNFGTFTFDSILHRLFGSSANLTQSVIFVKQLFPALILIIATSRRFDLG